MTGRLGVDFGTSNTVVTLWNDSTKDSNSLQLGNYSQPQETADGDVFIIPSLIHYDGNDKFFCGNQVLQRNLYHSLRTFQWMKRYIGRGDRSQRMIDGKGVTFFEAGENFLAQILKAAAQHVSNADEEIALTVPVETFEDYSNWLAKVVHKASLFRFRIIDEPSAAAIGYGTKLKPKDVYLVFDFGGGTLDVAIVAIDDNVGESGQFCRVLGKAGMDLGGTTIDQWLFSEVLKRNQRADGDADVKDISRLLLSECEKLKESLSFQEKGELDVLNPITGATISAEITRPQFEDLLDSHDAFAQIDKTIRRALNAAQNRGFHEDSIKSVLMVGGCSQIPAVQKSLKRIFGNERVLIDRPLDTVARGASAFVAGMAFEDYIQHDYAIRYVNPKTGGYEYRTLVRRGTRYPSVERMAVLIIKSSYDGQDKLGIPIFEIGGSAGVSGEQRADMYFDEQGLPRIRTITDQETARRNFFWINENNPTFLRAEPPGQKGDPRFRLEFSIDENRRLLITAYDIKNSNLVYRQYPVVKLV
jgi:molecular chaperone DnaK